MANTTNYNWETPDDTDLVKDGAAAIRTLGSSIDTTTKALNPSTTLGDIEYRSATANTNTRLGIGTTGQVLTVAGGVPTWATSDDANAIQNAIVDAKGDLIAASAADTPARLAVGANGTVLTADSAEATGLKWAAPAAGGGGKVLQVVQATTDTYALTGSSTLSATAITATITPTLNTSKVLILITVADCGTSNQSAGLGLMIRRGTSTNLLRIASFSGSEPSGSGARNIGTVSGNYLDSPATTSATTYNVYFQNLSAAGDAYINDYYNSSNKPFSTITLMEIGA
jgi:hypothetical protein